MRHLARHRIEEVKADRFARAAGWIVGDVGVPLGRFRAHVTEELADDGQADPRGYADAGVRVSEVVESGGGIPARFNTVRQGFLRS